MKAGTYNPEAQVVLEDDVKDQIMRITSALGTFETAIKELSKEVTQLKEQIKIQGGI